MDERRTLLRLETVPRRLFFSTLPNGEQEFAGFVCPPVQDTSWMSLREVTWAITDTTSQAASSTSRRAITNEEHTTGRFVVSAILPAHWSNSQLRIEARSDQQTYIDQWTITRYDQNKTFDLPLAGQVLVLVGHRIGETHRSAWQLPGQQFAWDFLPLDENGLRLLTTSLTESLQAQDFIGFGQAVMAPAGGRVARVVDGYPDLVRVGAHPEDMNYYPEHLERAAGNHVTIDHGEAVYSCLAHLRQDSITVREQQDVEAGQMIGALGNSGFSSGHHLHLHFMDSLDLRTASPLPIALRAEGRIYAPQGGDIIASWQLYCTNDTKGVSRMQKANPLEWLSEKDKENPSVRYFALTELLDRPADAPELVEAQRAVMTDGPVPAILDAQDPDGYWVKPGAGYSPKYRATVWQIIFLAELGADPSDERVGRGCEYLLSHSIARNGAFSVYQTLAPSGSVHCLNGNLLYALMRLGWADDPRVQAALEWQAAAITGEGQIQYYQPGTAGPGFACGVNEGQPCGWGANKALRALLALPSDQRTPVIERAIEAGAAFLLSRDPAVADYPYTGRVSSTWFRFGFPLSYWSDVLETAAVLVEAGYGKMWADLEEKGKAGKSGWFWF